MFEIISQIDELYKLNLETWFDNYGKYSFQSPNRK